MKAQTIERPAPSPTGPDPDAGVATMRFMILVKATPQSEDGVMPSEALMAAMARYHEQLAKAGVLLDASGLKTSRNGWRVLYDGAQRRVVDGPFAETRQLVAGYTTIQTRTREEALEWTRRFPNPAIDAGLAEIEVRQLFELEDFGSSEAVERFRQLDAQGT
jgi:hypothetical protein